MSGINAQNNICTALSLTYKELLNWEKEKQYLDPYQKKLLHNLKLHLQLANPGGKYVTSKLEDFKIKEDPTYNQKKFFESSADYVKEFLQEVNNLQEYRYEEIDEQKHFAEPDDSYQRYELVKLYAEAYRISKLLYDENMENFLNRLTNCYHMSYRMCRKLKEYEQKYPFHGDEGVWEKDKKMGEILKTSKKWKKELEKKYGKKPMIIKEISKHPLRTQLNNKVVTVHEKNALLRMIDIVKKFNPELVIELGTSWGGMTFFFQFLLQSHVKIYSFDDVNPRRPNKRIFNSNVHFYNCDLIEGNDKIVQKLIALCRSPLKKLLYLDNGHKIKEVIRYAHLLNVGDMVGIHDWGKEVHTDWDQIVNVEERCTKEEHELMCAILSDFGKNTFVNSYFGVRKEKNLVEGFTVEDIKRFKKVWNRGRGIRRKYKYSEKNSFNWDAFKKWLEKESGR